MSRAYCCEICSTDKPKWYLMRLGDAVVTWACSIHLDSVLDRLQRHRYEGEVTEVIVKRSAEAE